MRRFAYALALAVTASALASAGCSDVGDDSAVPEDAAAIEDSLATFPDGATSDDASAAADDAPAPLVNSGQVNSTVPQDDDSGGYEADADDAGAPDDAGGADASIADTGVPDATIADSGPDTSGAVDSGSDANAKGGDAGTDAAQDSSSGTDASPPADSGADAGAVLSACTMAGQTNCVECDNSAGNLCSPTEAAIVERDIAKGYATAPGPEPASACYECLASSSLLDDTSGDTGNECGDTSNPTECLATLNCILAAQCAANAVNVCYCGTAGVSSSCNATGAANAANGACDAQIAAGLGFAQNDGHDVLVNLISKDLPSGIADRIFQNAISNTCTTCQQ